MTSGKADKAFKGVGELFLGQVASKVFTFAFLIVFVRLLAREELAILPLYYAASGASTLLFSFGIPVTMIREIPRLRVAEPEKMYSLLYTGFMVVIAGVFISALLAILFEEQIQSLFFSSIGGHLEFKLIASAMLVGGWKTLLTFILKSLQMYRGMAIFTASNDLLYRALGLAGFFIAGINGLIAGFLLGTLITNLYCTWKLSPFIFKVKAWYPLHDLLRISWPYYFEAYLHYFRAQGDVLIISSLLGASALSVFFVAKRLYDLMMTLIASMENVMAPSLSQLLGHSQEAAVAGYSRMTILVSFAAIPMGLFAAGLSYSFIDVVGGSDYARDAWLPAALYCGTTILHSLVAMKISAIYVFGNPADRLKITISQFAVYFSLLYLLVMQFGIVGAPLAQIVSYITASTYAGRLLSNVIGDRHVSKMVWVVLGSTIAGVLILVALQMYYYAIFMLPVYLLAATLTALLLVSILLSGPDLQQVKELLPSQLERSFSAYMKLRAKLPL